MNLSMLLQAAQDVVVPAGTTTPLLGVSEVFMLLFITLGPPLKTPAVYFARTHQLDAKTQRALAFKTFLLATIRSGFAWKLAYLDTCDAARRRYHLLSGFPAYRARTIRAGCHPAIDTTSQQ